MLHHSGVSKQGHSLLDVKRFQTGSILQKVIEQLLGRLDDVLCPNRMYHCFPSKREFWDLKMSGVRN